MKVLVWRRVLLLTASLLLAQSALLIRDSAACYPGYRPKPGVTNPQINERDCEPIPKTPPPPPPPTTVSPPPKVEEPKSPPSPKVVKPKPPEPSIQPGDMARDAENRLRQLLEGGTAPPVTTPGSGEDAGSAIESLGKALRQQQPSGELVAAVPRPPDDG